MADTSKPQSQLDGNQTLKGAFNQTDASFTVGSFVTAKVGHKIERVAFSATTDDYSYYDGATLLYTIRVIYSSSAKEELNSAERIA
jgi:hypothetical protein